MSDAKQGEMLEYGIFRVNAYQDNDGREVQELVPRANANGGKVIYRGAAMIQVQAMTPRGPVRQDVRIGFLIPATGIEDAFTRFDGLVKERVEEMHERQKEQAARDRIVPAGNFTLLPGKGK